MSKQTHDQKRKKKLEERKRKARLTEALSLTYTGNKYKSDALSQTWLHTETAIYEVGVISRGKIFDHTVHAAVERLIRDMRSGDLPPLPEETSYTVGQEEGLIRMNIRRHWERRSANEWQPSQDDLIGVLRSLLATIESKKTAGPESVGYLRYLADFLTRQVGIKVESLPMEQESLEGPE